MCPFVDTFAAGLKIKEGIERKVHVPSFASSCFKIAVSLNSASIKTISFNLEICVINSKIRSHASCPLWF